MKIKVKDSKDIYNLLNISGYASYKKEVAVLLILNDSLEVEELIQLNIGTKNKVIIEPIKIFKDIILSEHKNFIVAHNHPSGNYDPSDSDIETCLSLKEKSQVLDLTFIDFMVTSSKGYCSFNDCHIV